METILSSPFVKSFLAGSISGTCSTLLFQPLDLLKTRLQTPSLAGIRHDGMVVIVKTVLQKEKLRGLWKGTTPSIARCVPGVGLYFSSLNTLQRHFGSANPNSLELIAMGASARCLTGITMLPLTVVKVRFESGLFHYGGVASALKTIYISEGRGGLYSGLIPTLVRDAPFSGLYLLFYSHAKKLVPTDFIEPGYTPLLHFSCGVVAGAMASVATQPADVIKTHMQMKPDQFSNIRQVAEHVYKTNGVTGFMSGIVPRTVRRTLMAALAWTIYEQVMSQLGLK